GGRGEGQGLARNGGAFAQPAARGRWRAGHRSQGTRGGPRGDMGARPGGLGHVGCRGLADPGRDAARATRGPRPRACGGESDRGRTGTGAEPAAATSPGDRAALLLRDRADGGLCADAASGSGGCDGRGHSVRAGRHDGGGRRDEPAPGARRATAGLSLAGPCAVARGACGRGRRGRGAAACAGRPAGRAEAASGGL
ncbi:MAG: hypothetical protein AVDCRST_MAG15-2712, partial [uncultured Rubellimicrobium sp.]